MPQSVASDAAEKTVPNSNRRLTIRLPACATMEVAVSPEQATAFQRVRVHDVSQGGVALILHSAPAVGDMIFLQVTNQLLGFTYDLAAEVRHTTPYVRGTWLVGLAFDEFLSAGEFAMLV